MFNTMGKAFVTLPKTYQFKELSYTPTYKLTSNIEDRMSYERHLSHFEELCQQEESFVVLRLIAAYDKEVNVNLKAAIEHASKFFERLLTLHPKEILECIVRVIRQEGDRDYKRYTEALLFIKPSLLEDAPGLYDLWNLEWRDVTGWIHNDVLIAALAKIGNHSVTLLKDTLSTEGNQENPSKVLEFILREIEYQCRSTSGTGVYLETHIWPKG